MGFDLFEMETWVDVDGRSQLHFVFAGCLYGGWWPSSSDLSFWLGGFLGFQYGFVRFFGSIFDGYWNGLVGFVLIWWFDVHIL